MLQGNILFVDDEKSLTELADKILSGSGYKVYVATSGNVAINILQQYNIDVVVCDINMP